MFNIESYTIIFTLFPRLLGCIYLFAFGAFLFQIKGLLGSSGILPTSDFLQAVHARYPFKCYTYIPTLFWLSPSDRMLLLVTGCGTVLSIGLIFGFFPLLSLCLLYFLYLSIVSVGQDFLSFGWEGFLLELTAYTILLNLTSLPTLMAWICILFLLFRFHIQAGAVKLQSHDPVWRDLTALAYHYQTQPIPNTIAWIIHKFPLWFHKASTVLMYGVELVVPFAIFTNEEGRTAAFIALFGLQFFIWATGNFSYLNHLTAVFCTLLLSNTTLSWLFTAPLKPANESEYLVFASTLLSLFCLGMQALQFWHHFFPNRNISKILNPFSPFHLFNRYGIFAVMTTTRFEIIIEGSEDGENWREYLFYYKPSETKRRPRRISPYQPRIDWQVWFLPFSDFYAERWLQQFLFHLLKGTPEVLGLLRENPFAGKPPQYIRCQTYEYVFSSFEERKREGNWWVRTYIGPYSPTLSLKM